MPFSDCYAICAKFGRLSYTYGVASGGIVSLYFLKSKSSFVSSTFSSFMCSWSLLRCFFSSPISAYNCHSFFLLSLIMRKATKFGYGGKPTPLCVKACPELEAAAASWLIGPSSRCLMSLDFWFILRTKT